MQINQSIRARNIGSRLIIGGKPFVGGVCLHDTAGSGTHSDTLYLAGPGDGRVVSVDYTVERDGAVYELNPDIVNKCTFHAGRATQWKAAGRVFRNHAVTQVLIGIELVQRAAIAQSSPVWPAEQIRSAAQLCFGLCRRFNLTKEQVTTHAQIITDGSRSDPRQFPFDSFWFYFNQYGNAAPGEGNDTNAFIPGPAADPLTNNVIYSVVAGDSLWKIAKQFSTTIEKLKADNNLSGPSNTIRPNQKIIIKK